MIDAQLRLEDERRLQRAAESLRDEYLTDSELTAFSVLDGDELYEEG
jgi:hypothetical protein